LESLEQVRDATRLLHQRIDTVKDHAEIHRDLQTVIAAANDLGASLKELGKAQSADGKNHLDHAATLLQAAALTAKTAAESSHSDPKSIRTALLNSVRNALQGITLAVAAKRAASMKRSA
jgi:hypothetical protein